MPEKNFKTRYALFKPKACTCIMIIVICPRFFIFNSVKFVISYIATLFVINVFVKKERGPTKEVVSRATLTTCEGLSMKFHGIKLGR